MWEQATSSKCQPIAGAEPKVVPVKCLNETPKQIADRMRAVATGLSDPADARAIRLYADWLEAHPDAEEVKELVKPSEPK
jgi:hypothetical protein